MDYPKVAIYSLFRDNAVGMYIDSYFERIKQLDYDPTYLRLYPVEGDSMDITYDLLIKAAEEATKVGYKSQVSRAMTGIPHFGSVVNADRFKCLSITANRALDTIAADGWADKIMLIESDLLFDSQLLRVLITTGKRFVAPLIFAGESFYDIWGFRDLNGNSVGSNFNPSRVTKLSSVGSCALFDAKPVYDGVRFPLEDCMVGLCRKYRERGYTIWTTPKAQVFQV